jgi:phosphate transport system substrate-binding protein
MNTGFHALICYATVGAVLAICVGACQSQPPAHASLVCAAPVPRPDGLIIAGSGSNLAAIRTVARLYEEAHPGVRVVIPESIGTGGAVRALADGAIDVGLASRALTDAERRLGVNETPYARVPLVFAAHPDVRADRLVVQDLIDMYRGVREKWPDGTPVVPIVREMGDSGRVALQRHVPELERVMADAFRTSRLKACHTDAEMRDALLSIPGALGFLDAGMVAFERLPLRVVAVDGVDPVIKTLSLLTRGTPAGETARFVGFVRSKAVSDEFARGGYLPPGQ